MAEATIIETVKKFISKINGDNVYDNVEDNGYVDDYGYTEYPSSIEETVEEESERRSGFRGFIESSKKVTPIQQHQIKMKIAKPTNYDQAEEIVQQLKMKNAVVMNLEYVSKDIARRIVDTVSGAVKALDGNMEKVSNSIFVVAPFNYDIVSEINKEKIETRMASNWIK